MSASELSAQTEWFHEFAKQSIDQIALQATEANRNLFSHYAATSLAKHKPPDGLAAEEFAHIVHELRENERRWNRALMSALIESQDLYRSQNQESAVSVLELFAASCPWRLFQQVALDQAYSYKEAQE